MDAFWNYLRELNMASMMLRVVLAMLIGGFVGFDRERKHRPAGFRTYMLICLGAASTQILSQYLDLMLTTRWADALAAVGKPTDTARIGAQVVTGIGFIATGTVLVTERHEVKGLTTAACLWTSACMGLAIGAGFYEAVLVGFALVVLVMKLIPLVERPFLSRSMNMNLYVEMDNIENVGEVVSFLRAGRIKVFDVELGKIEHNGVTNIKGLFNIRLPHHYPHTELLASVALLDGIVAIEEV